MDLVWSCTKLDEHIAIDFYTVLQNIASSIGNQSLLFFIEKVASTDLNSIKQREIELLKVLATKCSSSDAKTICLGFLWNFLFEECPSRKDLVLINNAMLSFLEIFKSTEWQLTMLYFERCAENFR